jgi:Histidine kinase-, DNA gyrase B-, and HSP90-like ATPase
MIKDISMSDKINAKPTKEFFIEMLTRDIPLDRAILDLIDNSVDAARRSQVASPEIKISFDSNSFRIFDNCGGLDLDDAKNYAFRFGRAKDAPPTPHSVGQFGVGMKRTLFKLGTAFSLTSVCGENAFRVAVDVGVWKELDDWEFEFVELNPEVGPPGSTEIRVDSLYPAVAEQLGQEGFLNDLGHECARAHFLALNSGVKLIINDREVPGYQIRLLQSDKIQPFVRSWTLDGVNIRVVAGISERKFDEGGWYILCNGRLVEAAEQTSITSWQSDGIPKYHPDYAFFRGVVQFDCDDSSKLPWTTTKTGVDQGSKIYRAALIQMRIAMREVIVFLRARAKEDALFKGQIIPNRLINTEIESTIREGLVSFDVLPVNEKFIGPSPAPVGPRPTTTSIQYTALVRDVEKIKASLGVSTNREVGEETFNYYKSYECTDE